MYKYSDLSYRRCVDDHMAPVKVRGSVLRLVTAGFWFQGRLWTGTGWWVVGGRVRVEGRMCVYLCGWVGWGGRGGG